MCLLLKTLSDAETVSKPEQQSTTDTLSWFGKKMTQQLCMQVALQTRMLCTRHVKPNPTTGSPARNVRLPSPVNKIRTQSWDMPNSQAKVTAKPSN